jgi:hypothetical protein
MRAALLAIALPGYGSSALPSDNHAQIKVWRSEGRLAAGPWKESMRFGANTSTVELLWVRHDPRSGLVALVPVNDAVRSALGAKAATDRSFANWAVKPWTQISETSRSRLPDGCFVLSSAGYGLTVASAADKRTFPASHHRMLPDGRVLLHGAPVGTRGLHPGAQAVVLDPRGAVVASASLPAGSSGRFDFVGPFLMSLQVAGPNAIVAVLDKQGGLLAGGLKTAEPVSITGFVHAVGTPGTAPGFVVCSAEGEWRVVWLDGVEPSPPMAQREWALGSARTQRGGLNVRSINENNRRAIAATQAALAREAAKRAETARLQAIAESKAKEYAAMLDTFEGLIAQKHLGRALAVTDRLDRGAMHRIHPQRWERACLAGAKQALETQENGTCIVFRTLLASFPIQPGSDAAVTLAALDSKIAAMTRRREAVAASAAAAATAAPVSYVRELPGDAMRAMYGAMRREMQAVGANYYGR